MKHLFMILALLFVSGLVWLGVDHQAQLRFGEWLLLDRNPIVFVKNAVRLPIWNCGNVPDPRYPCQGRGPEGFTRDLVARPLLNPRAITLVDLERRRTYRFRWNWFSMVGSCGGGDDMTFYLVAGRMVSPGDRPREIGRTFASAQAIHARTRPQVRLEKPLWPPVGLCEAQYIDQTAGKPFNVWLNIYAPESADRARMADQSWIRPAERSKFDIGCEKEVHNGIRWQMCRGTGQEFPGGPRGTLESQVESWYADLGDSAFIVQMNAHYIEPLFQYPQWYAERQAAVREVIDSIHVEELPPPTDEEVASGPGRLSRLGLYEKERIERIKAHRQKRAQERSWLGKWWDKRRGIQDYPLPEP